MIGIGDHDYVALRFEAFASQVLAPLVHPRRAPLAAAIFACGEPVPVAAALAADYQPVEPGHRWGPAWSTAWFRARGDVPASLAGWPVALRFSCGTEALLWQNGAPRQGFDDNRDTCLLLACASGGETIECFVEAACNHPLGVRAFWWDPPEWHRRWHEEKPGRLEACELVAVDHDLWRFTRKYDLARKLALALPEAAPRAKALLAGLRSISNEIPASAAREAALEQEPALDALLRGNGTAPATVCFAVGHAHLDTAWLWRVRETRRKALRSWANVLELMERFPRLHFLGSQAQHYCFVETDAPALFARIEERVAEGRFEPAGAMWVEPDCNLPSGESLVRQILHGVGYFTERFGERGRQRFLYLPDTFGFPASLPQIMCLAGLDTFITNKLSWCERNEFPHVTFRWRGIDGSEVLAHLTPGDNYNAPLEPEDLLHGEAKLLRLDHGALGPPRARLVHWLQPFGFGDGGGGPTAEMAQRAELAAGIDGLPRVEQTRVDAFCAALHAERAAARARGGRDLPVWDGELYLELHRGTLTTQAAVKRANAEAERRLRIVEAMLASLDDLRLADEVAPRLQEAWRIVLLHQFHDILPGSSIREVYDDVRADHARLDAMLADLEAVAKARLATMPGDGGLVFNPCSHVRSGFVDMADGPRWVTALPACAVGGAHGALSDAVDTGPRTLANAALRVELDEAGRIARLARRDSDEPCNVMGKGGARVPMNQLVLYDDRPRRWEAWDIDFDYPDKATPLDAAARIEVEEAGPGRGVIAVHHRFGASRLVQRYVLRAGARRLEVETEVDWREERRLLRALFPTGIRARHATFGIQFGHLERPTHRNTSWQEARFEVPGQGWMDLSQPGLGLAILDDGRFGRSAEDGCLGLSLLRAPRDPDATADRGTHRFRYALLPHAGDWRAARVRQEADELANPLVVVREGAPRDTVASAPFELSLPDGGDVEIAAFKTAEDGHGRILRLVERRGGRCPISLRWRASGDTQTCDLLERPLARAIERDARSGTIRCVLRPFEILTLRYESGAG